MFADREASGRRRSTRWIWAVVLLAAALRVVPIWFGLPFARARPDEETAIGHAVAMLDGDLNPHFFHWPSLTFYLFAALYAAASGIKRLLSAGAALSGTEHVVIARAIVALAGTLTVVVVYRLGRRVVDVTTGLIAAGFLAVAILHVRESHFAMTDVLMTLFVTASLGLLLVAIDTSSRNGGDRGPLRWFAAAGLAGGLATSTKYNAAAVLAAQVAAQTIWLSRTGQMLWSPAWSPSAVFAAAFAAGFIVATPYALLDFSAFVGDLKFDFTHLSEGHGLDLGRGWSYHLRRSLPYGLGVPIFAAGVAGIVPLVRYYRPHALVLGAFALAFYAAIGSGYTVFFRYILPLVPLLCVSAAVFVRHAASWLAARTNLSRGVWTGMLTGAIAVPALVNCVWFDVLLARTDTRVVAGEWLRPRLEPEHSLYDAGNEYVQLDLSGARFHRWLYDAAANSFGDPEGRTPDWLVLKESPLRGYASTPAPLRRLAAERYELVWTVRATKGRVRSAVYDQLDAFFMPLSGFSTVERPGPTILIYRRR